ncbi:hypothetical protein I316_00235 [Kwoniella heveanensis BCC8398]|uniref:Uncharacterized protein n=1 Tax=Kwoniella heveanensis BCC8398 TaxID=1296120 RepID=A0A1B9H414_9TREE|nr:hypothetical protein I316_00235 [Kwoniella heveanensis BCC8398]
MTGSRTNQRLPRMPRDLDPSEIAAYLTAVQPATGLRQLVAVLPLKGEHLMSISIAGIIVTPPSLSHLEITASLTQIPTTKRSRLNEDENNLVDALELRGHLETVWHEAPPALLDRMETIGLAKLPSWRASHPQAGQSCAAEDAIREGPSPHTDSFAQPNHPGYASYRANPTMSDYAYSRFYDPNDEYSYNPSTEGNPISPGPPPTSNPSAPNYDPLAL